MQEIYGLLAKEYGIKPTQIRILKALEKKGNDGATARELVKQTEIPIGSIYELLNELIEAKLVQERKAPNKVYYVEDLEQNFIGFADEQVYKQTKLREEVLSALNAKRQVVKAFDDYAEFKLECLKQEPWPKTVHGIISNFQFPIFFYPEEPNMYFKYKKTIKEYLNMPFSKTDEAKNEINTKHYKELNEKCEDFKWIVNKNEFEEFLRLVGRISNDEKKKTIARIRQALQAKNMQLRFTDQKKDYQFVVTPRNLQFQLRNFPVFIGMVISDEKTISEYEKMFANIWKNAESFEKISK